MKRRFALVVLLVVATWGALYAEPKAADFDIDKHLGTAWYGLYVSGKNSGYIVSTREKTTYNGKPAYKFSMEGVLALMVMGREQREGTNRYSTFYATGELAEKFSCDQQQGQRETYRGVVTGDQMEISSVVGGRSSTRAVPAPEMTLEDEIAEMRLVLGDPQPGASVTTKGYSLDDGEETTTVFTIKGNRTLLADGVETTVYDAERVSGEDGRRWTILLDDAGSVLRESAQVGRGKWEMRREPEEMAKDPNIEPVDITDAIAIRPKGKMPLFREERLRLKVSGMAQDEVIQDSRQQFEKVGDETWLVTLTLDSLPARPAILPVESPELTKFLKPTDLYQSEHPEIKAKAKQIVGEVDNSAQVAHAVCMWVHANLKKEWWLGDSNALDALRRAKGDCSEHTALFVALCRAAGVPARSVGGLAYSPSIRGFIAHVWAEVYVGKWIAVDPTDGQLVASADRIKLAAHDHLESDRGMSVIRRLSLEVVAKDDHQAE